MANQTSMADADHVAVLVISTTTVRLELTNGGDREWVIKHDSFDDSGNASTAVIIVSVNISTDVTNTHAEGSNKFKLTAGSSVTVGPRVRSISFRSVSGTATVSISASGKLRGQY